MQQIRKRISSGARNDGNLSTRRFLKEYGKMMPPPGT